MKNFLGETIWWAIYGVFKDDECLYVGATRNWWLREQTHKLRFGKKTDFKILHWSRSKERASLIERQMIRKFQKLGQAKSNKNGIKRKPAERRMIVVVDETLHYRLRETALRKRLTLTALAEQFLWEELKKDLQ